MPVQSDCCTGVLFVSVDERYKLRFIFLIRIFVIYKPNTKTINYEKIFIFIGSRCYVCRKS